MATTAIEITGRYIPKNSRRIDHPDGLGVVYAYENERGNPLAIAYAGKAAKPSWHHSFIGGDPFATREKRIAEFFGDLTDRQQRKAKRTEERKQPHNIPVGAIVVNSWGYDQTNIDFYEVVKTSANFVWLRELQSSTVETGFMCGHTTPVAGKYSTPSNGEPETTQHRVSMYNGHPSVNFEYGSGSIYKGGKERCSWYA